jgi:hypothetical protein
MPDAMGYLLRPIHAGMMSMESIHRTELDLNDFADANDFLDILHENQSRLTRWQEAKLRRSR